LVGSFIFVIFVMLLLTKTKKKFIMPKKNVAAKSITVKLSAKFNITRYGLKGMEIHNNSGKALKIFNTKKIDTDNWLEAVKWGEKNVNSINK